MSAPTLKPVKPRSRLGRLATAVTWVFWLFTVGTALQLIVALTRTGELFGPNLPGPHGQPVVVWLDLAPPLLQHAGSALIHSGLAPGVQAAWNSAILGVAHPTTGQALAFTLTLLPPGLLRIGTLYLVMRLARTAARDGVYTAQAARLVLILGWWLLAGGLVATFAQGFTRLNLLTKLVTGPVNWAHLPSDWGVSLPVL
jgi:hypothetical protein